MERYNFNVHNTFTKKQEYDPLESYQNRLMSLVHDLKEEMEAGDPYEQSINEFGTAIKKLQEEYRSNLKNLTKSLKEQLSSLPRAIGSGLNMLHEAHCDQNAKIDTSLATMEVKLESSMAKIERNLDFIIDKLSDRVPICNIRNETGGDNDRHSLQKSGSFFTARSSQSSITFTDDDDTLIGHLNVEVGNDTSKNPKEIKYKPVQSNTIGESNVQSSGTTKKLKDTLKDENLRKNYCSGHGAGRISPTVKKVPFNESHRSSKETGKEDLDSTTAMIKNQSSSWTTHKRSSNIKKFIIEPKTEDEESYSIMYMSKTPCTLHYFDWILKKFAFIGEGTCKIIYNVGKDKVYHKLIFSKPKETFKFHGQIDFGRTCKNQFVLNVQNGDDIDIFKIIFNITSECDKFTDSLESLSKLCMNHPNKKNMEWAEVFKNTR
uniref:Spindle and centriole-associated protein 1 n=1 Tax=Strongyloides papillosus TaxID=174720 RepID=A0A0N5BBV3_STREA